MIQTKLENYVKSILADSSLPLNAQDVKAELEKRDLVYSRQHIKRVLNHGVSSGIFELVGKDGNTDLFTITGQVLEPWQSAPSATIIRPTISLNGTNYSPDQLARLMSVVTADILKEQTVEDLRAYMALLIMGSAAYDVLTAHSVKPVSDIRRPLEQLNDRLKTLSTAIEAILSNRMVRTGESGNYITNQTRDQLVDQLEPWLTKISINRRSNIDEK